MDDCLDVNDIDSSKRKNAKYYINRSFDFQFLHLYFSSLKINKIQKPTVMTTSVYQPEKKITKQLRKRNREQSDRSGSHDGADPDPDADDREDPATKVSLSGKNQQKKKVAGKVENNIEKGIIIPASHRIIISRKGRW
jgi:hypothetical protein